MLVDQGLKPGFVVNPVSEVKALQLLSSFAVFDIDGTCMDSGNGLLSAIDGVSRPEK